MFYQGAVGGLGNYLKSEALAVLTSPEWMLPQRQPSSREPILAEPPWTHRYALTLRVSELTAPSALSLITASVI